MKRQGVILNSREVREGRRLLKKARSTSFLTKQVGALLSRGPAFAAAFARAAKMATPDGGIPLGDAEVLIRAAYFGPVEAKRMADMWDDWATEKETQLIEWGVESPFDREAAESYRRLAAAIRYIGSLN